jgi:acyl transferase domain-containing protein/NAD(P)-dependent dehydrogenase (short-subunit alcohol dehydrogenase family)
MTEKNTYDIAEPIAIVGLGAIFPQSASLKAFFHHIIEGSDLITDIPTSHWRVEDYYNADPSMPDKTYCKRGGFIPPVLFDSMKFGLPPQLHSSTDTAQMLGLLLAHTTLQDALGKTFESADRSRIACILGVTSGQELFGQMASRLAKPQWIEGMRRTGLHEKTVQEAAAHISDTFVPWTESTFPGLLGNVVAGRIANRMNLGGMNTVTDAACASSFAAVAMAVDELRLKRADMVLTGGVDALNDIFMYMCFSKTPALSASGECKPFDAESDGTLLGEGAGLLALMRLSDAEKQGHHIYALIRSVGASSDGKSKSVYAPVSTGQAMAITRAYEEAGVPASTVELIEAHGTGTKAGDVAELEGLRLAFTSRTSSSSETQKSKHKNDDSQDREPSITPWCAVGSVKSQIGHTKSAAGAAGLIKAALSLHHKVLPPTIKVKTPNSKFPWSTSPFVLNIKTRPWITKGAHPRRAGVSSFGFGGSNYHVLLEEYTGKQKASSMLTWPVALFCLSAENDEALKIKATSLHQKLQETLQADGFTALSHDSMRTFTSDDHIRLSFTAANPSDALQVISAYLSGAAAGKTFFVHQGKAPKAAVLFSGQGSQKVRMGETWARYFSQAMGVWDASSSLKVDGMTIAEVVHPAESFDETVQKSYQTKLTDTRYAQWGLAVTEASIWRVLESMNMRFDAVAGHSFGELSALMAAGVMDEKTLMSWAIARGGAMAAAASGEGAMVALSCSVEQANALCLDVQTSQEFLKEDILVMANHNAPQQCVCAGTKHGIALCIAAAKKQGIGAIPLQVSTAFHSPLMHKAVSSMKNYLEAFEGWSTCKAPKVPVASNRRGAWYPSLEKDLPKILTDELTQQLRESVRFVDLVQHMWNQDVRCFIEVGPGKTLTKLSKTICPESISISVDALADGKTILNTMAQLSSLGLLADLSVLTEHSVAYDVLEYKPVATANSTWINGSNIGKPSLNTPPNVDSSRVLNVEQPIKQFADHHNLSTTSMQPIQTKGNPSMKEKPTQSNAHNHSHHENHESPSNSAASTMVNAASWAQAILQAQQQAAQAHAMFQNALAQTHQTYLKTMESTTQMLASVLSGASIPGGAVPSLSSLVTPTPVVPFAHAPIAYPVASAFTSGTLIAPLQVMPSVSPVSVSSAPAVSTQAPVQVPVRSPVQNSVHNPGNFSSTTASGTHSTNGVTSKKNIDTAHVLLEVVSEKTGYPVSSLSLSMAMESDLGIDSIKRVEILSALKKHIPESSHLDAMAVANLQTLGDIVAVVDKQKSSQISTTKTSTVPSSNSNGVAHTQTSSEKHSTADAIKNAIADKTGYPVSSLNESMHLESDLGIDSIKRVEILSVLKNIFPVAQSLDAMTLAKLHTIGDWVKVLDPPPQDQGASSEKKGTQHPFELGGHGLRATMALVKTSRTHDELFQGPIRFWAPTPQTHQYATQLERLVRRKGVEITSVVEQPSVPLTSSSSTNRFVICLPNEEDLSLSASWGLLEHIFFQLQKWVKTGYGLNVVVLTSSQEEQSIHHKTATENTSPILHGLLGAMRSILLELPSSRCVWIDVRRENEVMPIHQGIVDEICSVIPIGMSEVVFEKTQRYQWQLQHSTRETYENTQRTIWKHDDFVVVTGGARGITAQCLIALSAHIQLRCLILARTALLEDPVWSQGIEDKTSLLKACLAWPAHKAFTPKQAKHEVERVMAMRESRQTITVLQKAGWKVVLAAVDVAIEKDVIEAVSQYRHQWGPVKAIIHGAGVLADKHFVEMTKNDYDTVVGPKLQGFGSLLEATKDDALHTIVVFSSAAGRFGNAGQSNYALANEAMTSWMMYISQRKQCQGIALHFGPWDGGMVTPALRQEFLSRGVRIVDIAGGTQAFVEELLFVKSTSSREVIIGGPLHQHSAYQHHKDLDVQSLKEHPMLEKSNNESMEAKDVFSVSLDIQPQDITHWVDHATEGVVRFPLAEAVKIMMQEGIRYLQNHGQDVYKHANNSAMRAIVMEKIEVVRGIPLPKWPLQSPLSCELSFKQSSSPVSSASVSCTLEYPLQTKRSFKSVLSMAHIDSVPALPTEIPTTMKMDKTLYHNNRSLFHGPQFQCLLSVHGDDTRWYGQCASAESMKWPSHKEHHLVFGMPLDSMMLDGLLQLALLAVENKIGVRSLPYLIERMTVMMPRESHTSVHSLSSIQCTIHIQSQNEHESCVDGWLYTDTGEVLAYVEALHVWHLDTVDRALLDASLTNSSAIASLSPDHILQESLSSSLMT